MNQRKRILVAPLNWGLGHASRCIPLIKMLQKQGAEVIIAADGPPLAILSSEFPETETIHFPGASIQYGEVLPTQLTLAIQLPAFLYGIRKEHRQLQDLIQQKKIDGILSDNRYGLHSKERPSILMTHQLEIQSRLFKPQFKKVIDWYLSNFSEVWIPDYEGEMNLAGNLSHTEKQRENAVFIGPLSRFTAQQAPGELKRKLMVVLSGPEPNRSSFERNLVNQLNALNYATLFVRGLPHSESPAAIEAGSHIQLVNHLPTEEMCREMMNSELIICRSGYSSIMDLAVLKKKALLIPTKGQIEQEYLADYHREHNRFHSVRESNLNLTVDVEKALQFEGIGQLLTSVDQEMIIQAFLKKC